jgi:uncharacterized protein YbjT (DUF2867 family)
MFLAEPAEPGVVSPKRSHEGHVMTVLVTGATGTVGSLVLTQLAERGSAPVRALTRSPQAACFPAGVTAVAGDLLDVDAMRAALDGVDTLFLLSAVTAEELTATLLTLNAAREHGIKGIVYLSIYQAENKVEVPHFMAKHASEQMIEQLDLPATILRCSYFAQNDLHVRDAVLRCGVYPIPLGERGVSVVDVRDVAEVAVLELVRRAEAPGPAPREVYDLVGPDALTGPDIAQIWSDLLDRPVRYGGNDLGPFTQMMRSYTPAWMAEDMRHMMARFQKEGLIATPAGLQHLTDRLGRPPRSYRDFAAELVHQWTAQP